MQCHLKMEKMSYQKSPCRICNKFEHTGNRDSDGRASLPTLYAQYTTVTNKIKHLLIHTKNNGRFMYVSRKIYFIFSVFHVIKNAFPYKGKVN